MNDPQLKEFKRNLRDGNQKDSVTLAISANKKSAQCDGTIGGLPAKGMLDATGLAVDASVQPAQLERFGEYVSVVEVHRLELETKYVLPCRCLTSHYRYASNGRHRQLYVECWLRTRRDKTERGRKTVDR
jgi:hypothetical protein